MVRFGAARTCGQQLQGRRIRTVGLSRTTYTGLTPRGGGGCGTWPRGGGAGRGRRIGRDRPGQHQQAAGCGRRGGPRRQREPDHVQRHPPPGGAARGWKAPWAGYQGRQSLAASGAGGGNVGGDGAREGEEERGPAEAEMEGSGARRAAGRAARLDLAARVARWPELGELWLAAAARGRARLAAAMGQLTCTVRVSFGRGLLECPTHSHPQLPPLTPRHLLLHPTLVTGPGLLRLIPPRGQATLGHRP